jgi:ABC-type glycerol-3-phosphate transport system substrate-binding protein
MPPGWETYSYLEALTNVAKGITAIYTGGWFGRGIYTILNYAPPEWRNANVFRLGVPPKGPDMKVWRPYFDGEPWMVFKASKNIELAKEWLRYFYRPDLHLEYCNSVPFHLLPITNTVWKMTDKLVITTTYKDWKQWLDVIKIYLENERNGYLVWYADPNTLKSPWGAELAGSPIFGELVLDVAVHGLSIDAAIKRAQTRAVDLKKTLGL